MPATQQLHVTVRYEDDSLWATVDEFPGVFATGDTVDELRESLEEGIALVLDRPNGEVPKVTIAPLTVEPSQTKARAELTCV